MPGRASLIPSLFRFFFSVANIIKHNAHKGEDYTDEQRPFSCHAATAIDGHRVGVNWVNYVFVVNNQADGNNNANYNKKYANFFHKFFANKAAWQRM